MPATTNTRNYRPDDVVQMTFDENFVAKIIVPKDLLLTQKMSANAAGLTEYVGFAIPGTATSDAKWLIRKITYDVNNFATDIQFASGTAKFDKVWDSRAGYSYS